MPFPPEGVKEKLKWWLFPWFPRKYLVLHDKDGEVHEFIDDEIRYIVKSDNITVIKCRFESNTKTVAILGQDPFVHANIYSPSELFGRYTMQWTMGFGFLIYTIFMFAAFLNLFNEWLIMLMIALGIYFMSVSRIRFQTPSVQYVVLHEFGSIEGYPLYVPGPHPQSALTFSQVSRLIGRMYDPSIKDRLLKELLKEVEVGKEIIKRLYGVIVRIERQSDKIYDSTYRLARLMAQDVLEEINERAERIIIKTKRFWMLMALVAMIIGFIIGYLVGQSVGISVSPPELHNVTSSIVTMPMPPGG